MAPSKLHSTQLLHYQHWFPVALTLQLMFSQFSCFDSEFTTEVFPLTCE